MQGDDRAALDSFAQAIKRNSDYLEAYQYRGFILSKLGYKLRADADKSMGSNRKNRTYLGRT